MTEETMDSNTKQFPTFLLILLILTSLNVLIQLSDTFSNLFVEDISTAIEFAVEDSDLDLSDIPEPYGSSFTDFLSNLIENFNSYNLYRLVFYLLLATSVILMARLRKSGFWLYVGLQIIGVFEYLIFFGSNLITWTAVVLSAVLALIFILLYRANKHHLS